MTHIFCKTSKTTHLDWHTIAPTYMILMQCDWHPQPGIRSFMQVEVSCSGRTSCYKHDRSCIALVPAKDPSQQAPDDAHQTCNCIGATILPQDTAGRQCGFASSWWPHNCYVTCHVMRHHLYGHTLFVVGSLTPLSAQDAAVWLPVTAQHAAVLLAS